jgi:hypothetical protein
MCYPIFAYAFCAVFTPGAVQAGAAPEAAVVRPAEEAAQPQAAVPAGEEARETVAVLIDLPEGRPAMALPGEGQPRAARDLRAPAPRLDRASYEQDRELEAKGSSSESGPSTAGEGGDTEEK